jgi:hypothetical protein
MLRVAEYENDTQDKRVLLTSQTRRKAKNFSRNLTESDPDLMIYSFIDQMNSMIVRANIRHGKR